MTTPERPIGVRADATDADIALYDRASAVLVTARATRDAAEAAYRAAQAAYYPTIHAVYHNNH